MPEEEAFTSPEKTLVAWHAWHQENPGFKTRLRSMKFPLESMAAPLDGVSFLFSVITGSSPACTRTSISSYLNQILENAFNKFR